ASEPAQAGPGAAGLLDPSQEAAVRTALEQPATLVTGAPGSGKTTVALEVAGRLLADPRIDPAGVLLLCATRRSAGAARDELAVRTGRTLRQPLVRTASSLAFGVLHRFETAADRPAPTLVSGPEQDQVIAELLAGRLAGDGPALVLPPGVPEEALRTRGFRDELRDVMMRAAERGIDPVELDLLGQRENRPAWRLCARLYEEYRDVMALREGTPDAGTRYDPAGVVDAAVGVLTTWDAERAGAARPQWRHVVVDDYQEATPALARLLTVLADDGARLTLIADPDLAVQGFRGAVPQLVGRASAPPGTQVGAFGASAVALGSVWRQGPALRQVVEHVAQHVPTAGTARHRQAPSAVPDQSGTVGAAVCPSPGQEHALIAHELRADHVLDGTPWGDMAVVARSGAQVEALRRALAAAGVPVSVLGSAGALRDEPAVRPLLTALDVTARCTQPGYAQSAGLDEDTAVELLTSPLGGFDAVSLRRLRRALRAEEIAGGGGRGSGHLLVEVLGDPARGATLPASVRSGTVRLARLLEQGRAAMDQPGANAQTVLWAVWEASRLAERWRSTALAGGAAGQRGDRDLDAVLALFKAAERFVERTRGAPVAQFVDYVRSQELPADSLAARGGTTDAVSVLTPAGAAGREWAVVVVAGLQDGVWPDLRLRDSLLGAQALADLDRTDRAVASGPGVRDGAGSRAERAADARRAVLADELRAYLVALTRARRRLLLTAVADEDRRPSPFLDLVVAPGDDADLADSRAVTAPEPLDLRGVVARARRALDRALERAEAGGAA
ncbi:MAG: ATP-dependent helicase, partial [Cellulomonadaceae bacterium]